MSDNVEPRLIAFYLPQYHPIPENSQWWGPGFTDWNNVARARPLFPGHPQPRLPRDLGFYDLRLAETREAQARLAHSYGIYGFCYYAYWFGGGRRLLERPLEAVLKEGTPDLPFCVCWANESWTRRWDGSHDDVLVAQAHDDTNNAAFFEAMLPYFRDRRYIRIDGRPLLLIYRATQLPDIAATLAQWRALARHHDVPTPYVAAVEFFDVNGAVMIAKGCDAICEFPPITAGADQSGFEVATAGMMPGFQGRLLDYERMTRWFERRPPVPYRRFRGVTLSWDNTARRGTRATVFVNFSLDRYRDWLRTAIENARRDAPAGERFVFVNAWNEWAEGTYLEPDQQNGLGYLEATRDALQRPVSVSAAVSAGKTVAAPARDAGVGDSTHSYAVRALVADSLVTDCGPSRASATPRARTGRSSLRLVGITCAGNEADVVEAFVRHNLAFLDHLLILEHNTLDGTRDILARLVAEGLPLTVTHSSDPKFRQILFTNGLLRSALDEQHADWAFAIDCDEFLRAGSRRELEIALAACGEAHMRLPWVNYVPSPGDDPNEPHPLRRIRHCYDYPSPGVDDNPWVWKIAVNARFLGDYHVDRYEICRGNHFLSLPGEQRPISAPMVEQRTIRLAHFPMRSADQMALKSALGILSRLGTDARSGYYGRTWKELTSGTIGIDALAAATRNFLDTGRYTAESLRDTPVKLDPIPVEVDLRYDNCRVPALGAILKWVELNLLDDAARRDSIWQDAR